ncbi:putative transposase for insertion sequence element IS702 [Frankliniella fusca]|uniref:Transposase for insertion sequence element IS702 n=1 Tax=Frankliniella fusca TaxID=407009 RepID=A0AAE1HUX0_9NEOP|nr:putative transposase for insertion sequence element IS702 [Frankliniella fusca]
MSFLLFTVQVFDYWCLLTPLSDVSVPMMSEPLIMENFKSEMTAESGPGTLNPELESINNNVSVEAPNASFVMALSEDNENQPTLRKNSPSEEKLFEVPVAESVPTSHITSDENPAVKSPSLMKDPSLDSLEKEIPMDTSLENAVNQKELQSSNLEVANNETNEDLESMKDESLHALLPCRLCANPYQGSSLVFLFCHPPHHPEVLPKGAHNSQGKEQLDDVLSMIKATLPVKVSCCDKLPKQVCTVCIERLRLSYEFRSTVLKAECQLNSLRAQHKSNETAEASSSHNSLSAYECPECKETPKQTDSSVSLTGHSGSFAWENIIIKDEPEDPIEPSHEELEKSYNEFFAGHKEVETFRTEERITLKPSKPMCLGGRRPRGRPRSRPFKVTPRGRRGRRSMQTTVERILELSGASHHNEDYGFRLRSRESNPASEALTQCLLCDRWLPGSAACLQHSLADHMDCGFFLCPRCPRDDFPGDFELIQHYQESHCPDLELYEVFQQPEKSNVGHVENSEQDTMDMNHHIEPEPDSVIPKSSVVKVIGPNKINDSLWPVETIDYENSTNTPPNEHYESQDEVSSNLSELAPRSVTSHSALYEEESNSISTHGSDSNLVSEDILAGHMSESHVLHDKLMGEASNLVDEVSFSSSPCGLVGDFTSDLREIEEDSQDHSKLTDKSTYCSPIHSSGGNVQNGDHENSEFKALREDSQESQDSLRADELCGFQEAINEKSQEVSLNGTTLHFDSDMPSSGGDGEPNVI